MRNRNREIRQQKQYDDLTMQDDDKFNFRKNNWLNWDGDDEDDEDEEKDKKKESEDCSLFGYGKIGENSREPREETPDFNSYGSSAPLAFRAPTLGGLKNNNSVNNSGNNNPNFTLNGTTANGKAKLVFPKLPDVEKDWLQKQNLNKSSVYVKRHHKSGLRQSEIKTDLSKYMKKNQASANKQLNRLDTINQNFGDSGNNNGRRYSDSEDLMSTNNFPAPSNTISTVGFNDTRLAETDQHTSTSMALANMMRKHAGKASISKKEKFDNDSVQPSSSGSGSGGTSSDSKSPAHRSRVESRY